MSRFIGSSPLMPHGATRRPSIRLGALEIRRADDTAAAETRKPRADDRSLTQKLFARAAEAEFLADIDQLNTPVDARRRVRRIAKLLLAHADRIKHGGIDPEGL